MSVRKLTARLLGSLVVLCGLSSAMAQGQYPLVDPMQFDPDFHWFEPIYNADIADMKPKKRANTGWFATYDRLNLYGSRPELFTNLQVSDYSMDGGWGHRYEVGFMVPDKDTGWLFSWVNNDVGEIFKVRRERANRINEDEIGGTATNPAPPFGFEAIPGISNNRGFNYRFVDIQTSENVIGFDSYELSKTWRMEPYHYGGMMEPMIGMRWFRIKDSVFLQEFTSSNDPAELTSLNPIAVSLGGGNGVDLMRTDQTYTENEVITGQLGFRYFKHFDRFMFSTSFRTFAGHNFQSAFANTHEEIVVYDTTPTVGQGDEIDRIIVNETPRVYERNDEFFLGFDVRGEISYQLVKAVTLRTGFQLIDIERGLWRGGIVGSNGTTGGGDNDQDYLMVGATFGITLNR